MERRTFIILEDDPAHAEAVRRSISASDNLCEVILAKNLEEFGKIASLKNPDLVIADINLPDGKAFELLAGDQEKQPWPVLIMTSFGDEEMAVKAIKSGAIDYIVKSPEAFKNIYRVIERNIREWRSYQKSRESESKFRILFETMGQGVIYHDIDGRIIMANSAAEKILEIAGEELQKKTPFVPILESIREDGTPFPSEEHPSVVALRTGLPVKDVIMGIKMHTSNTYKWLLVNSIPQFRENEAKPYQVFSTFADITELKQTEEELKKAKEKAEESDRLKSAFLANMSHEIRTPMNGILGFADLLKTPDLSGESQKKFIEMIEISGIRMLNIINDLIDISRIEAGQVELKKEVVSIPELLNELLQFFAPESEKKSINLTCNMELKSDEYFVETDRTKLAQVLINLLKNAIKFTGANGTIELRCNLHENRWVYFYVRDSGSGIRKELHGKIFGRFRQGDNSQEQDGVGLGLAISKAYVEILGGTIGLESEPGRGSVFFFTIPFIKPSDPSFLMVPEEPDSEIDGFILNVLVADDDDISYFLLKETLAKRKIRTIRAKNGIQAIECVKNNKEIDLVIMDIKMPLMSGIQATRKIKEIKPEIPVIIQSAFIEESEITQAFEAGCNDYITKPVNVEVLIDKIHDQIQSLRV